MPPGVKRLPGPPHYRGGIGNMGQDEARIDERYLPRRPIAGNIGLREGNIAEAGFFCLQPRQLKDFGVEIKTPDMTLRSGPPRQFQRHVAATAAQIDDSVPR